MEVAVLLDKKNIWLRDYIPKSLFERPNTSIEVLYEPDSVKNFNLVFVLGYTKILSKKISIENELCLVVHESNLPEGKGFSPVQWQILEGKSRIVVSLIELQEDVDSGDIFDQTEIVFQGGELYDEIRAMQASATFELVERAMDCYPNFQKVAQLGQSTFYRKRIPSDSELDIDKSIRSQFNLLRVANNQDWPSYFHLNGCKYILKIYKE